MVNWSCELDIVASIIVGDVGNGRGHVIWHFIGWFLAMLVILLCHAVIWRSLMELDCSVDSFSTKQSRCLGVNYHRLSFVGGVMDCSHSNTFLEVRVRRKLFRYCSNGHE